MQMGNVPTVETALYMFWREGDLRCEVAEAKAAPTRGVGVCRPQSSILRRLESGARLGARPR